MSNIAIIGNGHEGQWWGKFLTARKHKVSMSDSDNDTILLVPRVEVVFIAVPMRICESVAEIVACNTSEKQLVISVCGVQSEVEKVFQKHCTCDYAFLHRMIGTQVETMKNHASSLYRERVNQPKWKTFMAVLLQELQGCIVGVTPQQHDELVAVSQAMIRVITLAFGKMVMENHMLGKLTNVPFEGILLSLKRILDFGPGLTLDMIQCNPCAKDAITQFHSHMRQIEQSDPATLEQTFKDLAEFFGKPDVRAGSAALAQTLDRLHGNA